MSDTTMDPKAIAQAVAVTVSDEDGQVGDFVEAIDLGDNVTDFRFESRVRGYEGWQWSVTLYHDVELDHWTVNESSGPDRQGPASAKMDSLEGPSRAGRFGGDRFNRHRSR